MQQRLLAAFGLIFAVALLLGADSRSTIIVERSTAAAANQVGSCVSVTTSSTNVLASFATRHHATLIALDSNTARVRFRLGATATTSDMPLPAGTSYVMDSLTMYTGVVDAIAESGTQTVCKVEW